MRTLVTGGAGYIGGHVVESLRKRSERVIVVDDFVTGKASRIDGISFARMDLASDRSVGSLISLLREHEIEAVVHFAARKQVGESVLRPAWYFQQNVGSLANLLMAMQAADVRSLVFSSSAAVYGATEGAAIRETDPAVPINPYGQTKLIGEQLIADASNAFGLRAVSLRYFNVGGTASLRLADDAGLNLLPMVFERIDAGERPLIFGDDYPTPDGTCVRDYVHVVDLAEAHLAALEYLRAAPAGAEVFNVGTGAGTSVREMVDLILEAARSNLTAQVQPRREGDPAWVVAAPGLFEERVGWHARLGIREIVASAWQAHAAGVAQSADGTISDAAGRLPG